MATILAKHTIRDKWIVSLSDTPDTGLGTDCPLGSIALVNKVGVVTQWQKTGAGATQWTQVGSGNNETEVDLIPLGTTNIDWNLGNSFRTAISSNTAFTFSNSANAKTIYFTVSNTSAVAPITISFSGVTVNSSFNGVIYPLAKLFLKITEVNGVYYIDQENYKPIDTDLATNGGFIIGDYGSSWHWSTGVNPTITCAYFSNGRKSSLFVENTGAGPITINLVGVGLTIKTATGTTLTLNAGERYIYELNTFISLTLSAQVLFVRGIKY